MWANVSGLFAKLWRDDCGALIPTEYLTLGTVVVLGSIGGLVAMRDATVDEMHEFGDSVRSVRQQYAVPTRYNAAAVKHGSRTVDPSPATSYTMVP